MKTIKGKTQALNVFELETEKAKLKKSLIAIENQLKSVEKQEEEKFLATPEYKKIKELIQKLDCYINIPFTVEKEFQIKFGLKARINCDAVGIHMFFIDYSDDLETYLIKDEIESYAICSDIFKFSPIKTDGLQLNKLSDLIIDCNNRDDVIEVDSYIEECKSSITQLTKLKSFLNKIQFNIKFKLILPCYEHGVLDNYNVKIKVLDVGDVLKPRTFKAAIEEFFCIDFVKETCLDDKEEENPNFKGKDVLKKELNGIVGKLMKSSAWNETVSNIIENLDQEYHITV